MRSISAASGGSWPQATATPIRVMLVDDSVVARSIFARVLGNCDGIEIICEASDGDAAVASLEENEVDIILLDIEMPKRSGLDALPDILAKANGARVLVVSAFAEENGPAAVQALSLGACDTLAKPGRTGFSGRFSEILIEKVLRLGRSALERTDSKYTARPLPDYRALSKPSCIAIGSSTGGIPAIQHILRNLDDSLDCPIFITQHLPAAFMPFFAGQLAGLTKRTVKVAEAGECVKNNHVYLAPGRAHLVCHRDGNDVIIGHQSRYSASRYCPSVDAMLASVARAYGRDALALVFSGMGNDGLVGARAFNAWAAPVVVQDMQSSVVWGMPGAIVKEGLATAIMTPADMTDMLSRIATSS
ncbi:chemotaxis-specific protein-glutamate methyltransferase CheB [Sphingorhabdus sp.]|uniref:chemotaxis-specific protein-glutamate methyltransferase CheB n=1 Tax=Sphingorhabdus sp. TaxID=1902408 RepID=UPI0037C561DA